MRGVNHRGAASTDRDGAVAQVVMHTPLFNSPSPGTRYWRTRGKRDAVVQVVLGTRAPGSPVIETFRFFGGDHFLCLFLASGAGDLGSGCAREVCALGGRPILWSMPTRT